LEKIVTHASANTMAVLRGKMEQPVKKLTADSVKRLPEPVSMAEQCDK